LTVRPNTERPITIKSGTNKLVPRNRDAIVSEIQAAIARTRAATAQPPEFWDGKAAERIVSLFRSLSG
jgi:UDP-N-acetylglucosamine 2-epimerase (non-hydrolysing)